MLKRHDLNNKSNMNYIKLFHNKKEKKKTENRNKSYNGNKIKLKIFFNVRWKYMYSIVKPGGINLNIMQ